MPSYSKCCICSIFFPCLEWLIKTSMCYVDSFSLFFVRLQSGVSFRLFDNCRSSYNSVSFPLETSLCLTFHHFVKRLHCHCWTTIDQRASKHFIVVYIHGNAFKISPHEHFGFTRFWWICAWPLSKPWANTEINCFS